MSRVWVNFAKPSRMNYTLYALPDKMDQSASESNLSAMRFFFYGTLCDPDVLSLVLGYQPARQQLAPATLPGFRRKVALGQDGRRSYPVLLPAPGGLVQGQLFTPRSPEDSRRLTAYEGPEYRTRQRLVRTRRGQCAARLFLPSPGSLRAALADWHLPAWRQHHKAGFLAHLKQQSEAEIPCANP